MKIFLTAILLALSLLCTSCYEHHSSSSGTSTSQSQMGYMFGLFDTKCGNSGNHSLGGSSSNVQIHTPAR